MTLPRTSNCRGNGSNFLIDVSEGYVVTDAARYVDRREASRMKSEQYEEVLGGTNNLKSLQSMLMSAMERKNQLLKLASEEVQSKIF